VYDVRVYRQSVDTGEIVLAEEEIGLNPAALLSLLSEEVNQGGFLATVHQRQILREVNP
jgi:hypothetical protein